MLSEILILNGKKLTEVKIRRSVWFIEDD
jgi:hypothetical protein